MNIDIVRIPEDHLKPKPEKDAPLGFGKIFTDYMFSMEYNEDEGWINPTIRKYEQISLYPSSIIFHYAQSIFEGLKGYLRTDGKIGLFRYERNCVRLNKSAERMCMPTIPVEMQQQALFELLKLEKDWFPSGENETVYIRPTMIGTAPRLGVRSSDTFLYYIILSPSGAYFGGSFSPVTVFVSDKYVRAADGGTGYAKTGGNYAGTLLAGKEAKEKGCDQVLWMDAKEKRYVEEIGAMNIFFVFGKTIVTSELHGTILDGVTRNSIIHLTRDLGYTVEERRISIDEVIEGSESGALTESFGCGTAAVISPVGKLLYKDTLHNLSDEPGPVSRMMYKELTDLQWGRKEDTFGWITIVE